jgi:hypothetical protein
VARVTYSPDDLGKEVVAPSGYYQPLEEGSLDYAGKRLLYTLGTACIEASCCGRGTWDYLRVEGYVIAGASADLTGGLPVEIDTVEEVAERAAIIGLLQEKHPGARIEFR